MKKFFLSILMLALVLGGATSVVAATYKSPAEIYAELKGLTVEEAYSERAVTRNTFGQLAEEAGILDEYKSEVLENRKSLLQESVTNGEITQEQADAIIERVELNQAYCDGPGSYGYGYGHNGKEYRRWQNNNDYQNGYFRQGRGMNGGGFCGGRGF